MTMTKPTEPTLLEDVDRETLSKEALKAVADFENEINAGLLALHTAEAARVEREQKNRVINWFATKLSLP